MMSIWRLARVAPFLLAAPCMPAWAGEPNSCTAEMLDVRVLPLIESHTVTEVKTLVIEMQNRSPSACRLLAGEVALLPRSGADELTSNQFVSQEDSGHGFENHDPTLLPGDMAHVLVAWPSRAQWNSFEGCFDRDRLTLSLDPNLAPTLSVEHLWMRLCDRAYVSGYRPGAYAGEGIPADWLQRFKDDASNFSAPRVESGAAAGTQSISTLTMSDRAMLRDYFELILDLPRIDFDCPFAVLRKREANGATKVYMNQCTMITAEERARSGLQPQKWSARLNLPELGLQPERTGRVEYEAISNIEPAGQYASANTRIRIRDPELPALPAIDTPLPDCKAAQLHWKTLLSLDGGKFHEAHVYQVTNTSNDACAVGGVPQITFSHPERQSYTWIPTACPNCEDSLYQPRPSGWIDLKPGDAAHFFVGATRYNTEAGRWRLICSTVATLEVKLPGEDQKATLPFGVGTCAQVNISAWRAGPYDGDPLNLSYDKLREKKKTTLQAHPAPAECMGTADEAGHPVFFSPDHNLAFGISVERDHFLKGDPVGVHVWTANTSDKPISYMTCPGVFEMNLYDSYNHRLLSRSEEKQREQGNDQSPHLVVCTATFGITVPAHSCSVSRDPVILSDQYSLPPGEYVITRRPAEDFEGNSSKPLVSDSPPPGLMISVDQP